MASLTEYYGKMKSGIGTINPQDMAQLGEDWMVAAATGAGIGLMSAALGGLDKKVAGINVPLDGLVAGGLGLAGLQIDGDGGKILKLASIAACGSVSVRMFEKFFKAGFKAKGELEDLGSTGIQGHQLYGAPQDRLSQQALYGEYSEQLIGPDVGFGASAQDRLVEASKYL
jgi:hypothetical protein